MLKIVIKSNLIFIENINDPITESFEKFPFLMEYKEFYKKHTIIYE